MRKKYWGIQFVGYSLIVLCIFSILAYLQLLKIAETKYHVAGLIILFGLMLVATIGVVRGAKWGGRLILVASMMNAVYTLTLYCQFPELVSVLYVILYCVVYLYFGQKKISALIDPKSEEEWRSILIIDDDEALIKTTRSILIKEGYAVLSATSGEDGLHIVNHHKPDLVILDVILPGIKGRELCKEIKSNEQVKDIPVVFLTAKDSKDDIAAEKDVGAEAHLTKPVNARELVATVRGILGS